MTIAEIKDQIADSFKTRWAELQETSLYIQLKEKYDDLSPAMQKLVLVFAASIVALFLVMPPWSWIDSSTTFVENFESKKALIRNLLQLKRDIAQAPQVPNGAPSSALKAQVTSAIQTLGLNSDQIKSIEEVSLSNDGSSNLIPNSIIQSGVQLTVWKINLDQFVDLSYKIQKLNPSTKLLSIDMKANSEDNHYYDVIYQLISFAAPQTEIADTGGDGK